MSTPSYRGVSQNDLIRSIDNALELLETHSTGAACQAYIDGLRVIDGATGVSKLGAIALAKTDSALADAIADSGLTYLFRRSKEVLEFHAAVDTQGKGLSVMRDLTTWKAFQGEVGFMMTHEYNALDRECDAYIVIQGLRTAQKSRLSMKDDFMRTATVFSNASRQEAETTLSHVDKLNKLAVIEQDDQSIVASFDEMTGRERYLVKGAIKHVVTSNKL